MLRPFLENLFSNNDDVKNGCLYRGFVQINEIYCYYDKCIYEEFRSFISANAKDLKSSKKLLEVLRKFKNFMKKKEYKGLKMAGHPKTLKNREETLRQIVQLNDFSAKDSARIGKMITTLYESFQKIKFKSPISNTNVNFEMICFGSFINGFSISNSDVDCTILTNSYMEERIFLGYLSVALNSLRPEDFEFLCLNNKLIRIPILKIHSGKLGEMDLAINNVLGVANHF